MKLQEFLKKHNLTIEELDQIIKEETERLQKVNYLSELKEKKKALMEELEACENDESDLDEMFGVFGTKKTPEQKFAETEKKLMSHPVKSKHLAKLKTENPDKYKKYVEFWAENPDAAHIQWNEQSQQYEDKGISVANSILSTGGKVVQKESEKS